jgi:hypothetical protein
MAMGKRKRDRQPAMWVTTTDLPAASHPFYRRLNQLLREQEHQHFHRELLLRPKFCRSSAPQLRLRFIGLGD